MDQKPMWVLAGDVERRADGEREEPGAAPPLVEQRPAGWRLDAGGGAEQIELGCARGGAHPQRPHPHCWQQRQPEARTTRAGALGAPAYEEAG